MSMTTPFVFLFAILGIYNKLKYRYCELLRQQKNRNKSVNYAIAHHFLSLEIRQNRSLGVVARQLDGVTGDDDEGQRVGDSVGRR